MAARIEVLRIAAVDAAEQYGQRIGMAGNGREVDMVGHQAKTEDPDAAVREVGGAGRATLAGPGWSKRSSDSRYRAE